MMKLKRNLVISTVGDKSLHKCWSNHNDSQYHKLLIYYGDEKGYKEDSCYYHEQKGYKYHLIYDAIKNMGSRLDQYDYVWLPDDDIYLEEHDLIKLFKYMNNYDLSIAQPSILGWYGVDITLHQKGSLLRYTNWVEIMCPCFSVPALKLCLDTFKENDCGWGIETLWNVKLNHPTDKIAIIDDVAAFHTRPVFGGDTYRENNPLKEAMSQAIKIYENHKLGREMEKDLEFGHPTNGEVYCSVVYKQIKKEMEFDIKKPDRFWPPCDSMKNFLQELTNK